MQIVVVDGGSFDGCDEMLAAEFPEVEFVQSPGNFGFGFSNNLGFERVRGEWLLLLNPDCELHLGAIQALLNALESLPQAGMLGPRLLNTDGSLQTSCVRALPTPWNCALDSDWLRRLFPRSRMWGNWEAFHSDSPVEVEAVSGACMFLRSAVFARVNGFSREFFMYGEDMDICAKVRRLGFAVYHVPRAVVVHHGGRSSQNQASHFSTVMMRMAGEIYMRLNRGRWAAWNYRALQALSAVVRLAILLPPHIVSLPVAGRSASASLLKWWSILRWAIGCNPIRPPDLSFPSQNPAPVKPVGSPHAKTT